MRVVKVSRTIRQEYVLPVTDYTDEDTDEQMTDEEIYADEMDMSKDKIVSDIVPTDIIYVTTFVEFNTVNDDTYMDLFGEESPNVESNVESSELEISN
jgi:asparagine N-glycosylation enzyme membrane subunit Stt3